MSQRLSERCQADVNWTKCLLTKMYLARILMISAATFVKQEAWHGMSDFLPKHFCFRARFADFLSPFVCAKLAQKQLGFRVRVCGFKLRLSKCPKKFALESNDGFGELTFITVGWTRFFVTLEQNDRAREERPQL